MYKKCSPKIIVDTKQLVLKVNGVAQYDHAGIPIMDEKAWLELRRDGIGGSEASIIMGTNPWKSRQQLADDKRGVTPMKQLSENTMALTVGHMFEGAIRYKVLPYLLQKHGVYDFQVDEDSRMYCHGNPDYAFARANLDGLIRLNGRLGIIEIKTTSWRNADTIEMWKAGTVPLYYEAQCRHYMAVMNLDFVFICCAWGFNPETEAALIRIDRNAVSEQELMDAEREFWENHVVLGFPVEEETCSPSVARVYYCSRMLRNRNKTAVMLDEKTLTPLINERSLLLSRIREVKNEAAAVQEELDGIELSIMRALGNDSCGVYMKDATHRVTVEANNKLENRSFDLEAVRKNCPDLYDKAAEIRFSVSKLSVSEQERIKQYQLPQKPNGKVEVKVWETELDASGNPIKGSRTKKVS